MIINYFIIASVQLYVNVDNFYVPRCRIELQSLVFQTNAVTALATAA